MKHARVALVFCLAASAALAAPERIEITIRDRAVTGDLNVVRVTQAASIELQVSTDEAVTLHLHGYDLEFVVTPDEPVVIEFEAFATGRFPISSHGWAGDDDGHQHGHETLLYLEVYPR